MSDLKTRLAALLATSEGKAIIEEGQQFSVEELHEAFAQLLAEADDNERILIEAARDVLIARMAN